MGKETKKQRRRRYYLHRVLRKKKFEVLAREKTVNVPYDINLQGHPKIIELQQLNYNIQTTIK